MKKKALIFGGIVLVIGIVAVTCAVLFLDKDKDNSKALEFKEEYEKVNGEIARYKKPHRTLNIPEDNPYIKTTPAEILKKIENKETFYLYVGDHLCPWCRSVIEQSIKSAKENGVDEIFYIDFWDDENNEILRDVYELVDGEIKQTVKPTKEYTKLLSLCNDSLNLRNYEVEDADGNMVEVNSKRFYGPSFFFIKEGKFVKYTDARSEKQKSPLEDLTKEIKEDMAKNFDDLFLDICDDAC